MSSSQITAGGRYSQSIADIKISPASSIPNQCKWKEGLLVAVIQQPNANLIDVSAQVSSKIEELKILPRGVTIRSIIYRPTSLIIHQKRNRQFVD
jgi:multidrug efflux pump subunit AcrB